MTSHDKADHWGHLASDLGAEVPPEAAPEESPKPADTAGQPPKLHEPGPAPAGTKWTPPAAKPKSPPRRPTPGWATLAEQFGLSEPGPLAEKLAEAATPVAESEITVPPAPVEPAESIELAPAREQPLGETLPGGQRVVDEAAGEAESTMPEAADKPPPRKRRKRHRRTRKSDIVITPAEAAKEEVELLSGPDAVDLFQEDRAEAPVEAEPMPEEPKAEETEATEVRPKRRRRRRPGRAKSAGQAPIEQPGEPAGARSEEPESGGEDEESGGDDEGSSTTESSPTHRGIPTWQEAVGVIISANIEARGKRPSGPPSRPRGGRGRGGREGSRKPN